jgi:hypothetical protein
MYDWIHYITRNNRGHDLQKNHYFGWVLKQKTSRVKIGMLFDVSFVIVPVSALIHPQCVTPESFMGEDTFLIVLPKQNWSCFFGDKISIQ